MSIFITGTFPAKRLQRGMTLTARQEKPPEGRLLGIDMGSKTLGLALFTPHADMVTPLKTIKRAKWADDLKALDDIMLEYRVAGIVVGYPLESDGTEGRRCQSVRGFVRNLQDAFPGMWVGLHDERYSTQAAEEALLALDASRETRRAVGDAVAAQFILQGFIDGQG